MRTIKFRAWDAFNSKMYYPDGNGYFFDEFSHNDFVIDGNGQPIFLSDMSTPDKIILEQFTGLQDKNGKDIYEGDIIEEGGKNGTIVWNNEYARFEIEMNNGRAGMYLVHGTVIGNIHESKN